MGSIPTDSTINALESPALPAASTAAFAIGVVLGLRPEEKVSGIATGWRIAGVPDLGFIICGAVGQFVGNAMRPDWRFGCDDLELAVAVAVA